MLKRIQDLLVAMVALSVLAAVLALPFGLAVADAPDGKSLYEKKCAMCHGSDGVAKEMWAKKGMKNLNDPAWQKEVTDEQIAKDTAEGIPDKKMPGYKDKLSTEEIDAIVKYIRTLK